MAKHNQKEKVGLWLDPQWNRALSDMSEHMGLAKGDIAAAAVSLFMAASHEERRHALQDVIGRRFDEVAAQAEDAASQAQAGAERRRRGTPRNRRNTG